VAGQTVLQVLPLSHGNSLLSNQVDLSAETHHNKIVCKNTQKDQVLFLDAIMRGEGLRVASDTLTKFLTPVWVCDVNEKPLHREG